MEVVVSGAVVLLLEAACFLFNFDNSLPVVDAVASGAVVLMLGAACFLASFLFNSFKLPRGGALLALILKHKRLKTENFETKE